MTALARRGKVVHFKGHGLMDVEARRPMSRDAIFTHDVVYESRSRRRGDDDDRAGTHSLERSGGKYIPELADMQVAVLKDPADEDIGPLKVDRRKPPAHRLVPAKTLITIHHLLTHTSGLMSGGLGAAVSGRGKERARDAGRLHPTLGEVPLDFQPGSRRAYRATTGLDVVARIIEIVSGTPFDEFVQTRILDPLGMNDMHYNLPPSTSPLCGLMFSRSHCSAMASASAWTLSPATSSTPKGMKPWNAEAK